MIHFQHKLAIACIAAARLVITSDFAVPCFPLHVNTSIPCMMTDEHLSRVQRLASMHVQKRPFPEKTISNTILLLLVQAHATPCSHVETCHCMHVQGRSRSAGRLAAACPSFSPSARPMPRSCRTWQVVMKPGSTFLQLPWGCSWLAEQDSTLHSKISSRSATAQSHSLLSPEAASLSDECLLKLPRCRETCCDTLRLSRYQISCCCEIALP